MKHLILMTFLITQTLFAAEKEPVKNEVKGGIVINESLQKLIDIDGVKPLYEKCNKAGGGAETILNCLWKDVQKNPDLQKKVQTAYEQQLKPKETASNQAGASRAPASSESKTNLTGRVNASSVDYGSDPAVNALSDYYGKKLDAILDPEQALSKEEKEKGIILATNHRKFIDLYKSELGKTIINAFTSYCLDVDPATCQCDPAKIKACTDKENPASCCDEVKCAISAEANLKDNRAKNIASLKTADLSSDGPDSVKWRMCISSVPKSCKEKSSTASADTIKRSCLIMDYVETARKNIMVADDQIKFYDGLEKTTGVTVGGIGKSIDDPSKSSSDAILEISSEDVKDSLKATKDKEKLEFEQCFKDDQVVNEKACEKYLSKNADANNTAIAELGLRQLAQEANLEDKLKDEKNVAAYLKEEGFSENDIKEMTDKTNITTTKDEILQRYKNQKKAIIAEMAAKIESKTSTKNGEITEASDKSKLQKIRDEINSRSDDLSGLVKFNNIVSSYLEVKKDGSKKTERNTASLYGEVKDLKGADQKTAQAQLEAAQLKENKNPNGDSQTNLDVSTINSDFLNYSTVKKKTP